MYPTKSANMQLVCHAALVLFATTFMSPFYHIFFLAGLNRRIKEVLHKVSLVCCLFTHMEVKTTLKSEMEKKIPQKDMHLNRICNLCKIF